MEQTTATRRTYKAFFVFSGEGGGALGAVQALPAIIGDDTAVCEVIGGVDVDKLACEDAEKWTGVPFTQLDLFDRDQYIAFHGKEPPADWREATPDDLRRAAGYQVPDIVIITAPCKGFSGLLGKEKAQTAKYKALNRLAERGLFLVLETWKPAFLGFENVKGIQTRGAVFLSKIVQLLQAYKYLWHPDHYDCGVWGNLAQHRFRYMAFARDPEQVPCFLYNPPENRVRAIEEVIGDMPMPIDPDNLPEDLDAAGGPMHMSPRLQWKTWVRLALIPPGGDWRDLQKIKPGEYSIVPVPGKPKHFDIVRTDSLKGAGATVSDPGGPSDGQKHANKYRVEDAAGAAHTVTGNDRLGSGAPSVADPRPIIGNVAMEGFSEDRTHHVKYLVQEMDGAANTVTGQKDVQTGAPIVADHRLNDSENRHGNQFRVQGMDEAAGTVTAHNAGSGAACVADSKPNWYDTSHRVTPIDEPSPTVTGQGSPSGAAVVISDPRPLGHTPMGGGKGAYLVQDVSEASGTITGDPSHRKSGGASVIADHRLDSHQRDGAMRVGDVSEPSGPVIGSAAVTSSNGIGAVADPRSTDRFNNVQAVNDMADPAKAVTAACATSNAAAVVADPAPELYGNMLRVNDVAEPGNTVTGAAGVNQGANLIADPKPTCHMRNGTMGVCDTSEAAPTVIGAADLHNGGLSTVADPRLSGDNHGQIVDAGRIPGDEERGVWYIRSPHTDKKGRRCWHRPMTTLELLAIQGFPTRRPDGSAVVLAGKSDRSWRERIGNAWPPPAAAAIIGNMLMSLLASEIVGFLWDYQQTGILVLPPGAVPERERPVA